MNDELERFLNGIRQRIEENHPHPPAENQYECPKCKDTGWVERIDEDGRIFAVPCECLPMKKARQLIERSGISAAFMEKSFENFATRNIPQLIAAKGKAMKYLEDFEHCEKSRYNSILFCGQVGSGKTHLGIAICRGLMEKGIAVSYMAYRNTVTKIKQLLTDEKEYDRELEKYMQARVLYIDDLLKGRITESDVNILYEIVNYRYMNSLPFIISTEKFPNDLLTFDEAIGSRIVEMCRGNIIQLQGKELNYRLS